MNPDKDTLELTLEGIRDELASIKVMMEEVLIWKAEFEESMSNVQNGGILGMMSKMLSKG